MKLLVLGKGFLGKEYERWGHTVLDKTQFHYNPSINQISGRNFWNLINNYDAIVNCIGKSNTRWNETNFNEAIDVNAKLVKHLSDLCQKYNKRFVHISTGCLYDNYLKENTESSFMAAHCNYTVTKWIGEKQCHNDDLILRPRLLFSDVLDKNNLLCKLPKFKHYVYDQKDSLTRTSTIIEATTALLEAKQAGIFNVAEDDAASIAEIAEWCQIKTDNQITIEQLRKEQSIYLVNNVMDLTKLKQFYKPKKLKDQIIYCYNKLYETS